MRHPGPLLLISIAAGCLVACGGGSQSTPPPANRTVTVSWVDTAWTSGGPTKVPVPSKFPPSALVPQPDGSFQMLPGTMVEPGSYTIANVPTGYYWLLEGLPSGLPAIGFWTNSSSFDLGRDVLGSPVGVLSSSETITFDFNLSGLDPSLPPGVVAFDPNGPPPVPIYVTPQPGSTTLQSSASLTSKLDWSTVNTAFLMQFEPLSLGPLNNLVLGPEATLSNLSLTNGATNPITATLTPSPSASINLSIPGSQWAPLFQSVAPAATTPWGSFLSLAIEPYVTGVNVSPSPISPNFALVEPNTNGMPTVLGICPGQFFFIPATGDPPILTDQNFGTLEYGDPFPATWTRAVNFCQSVSFPFSVPGGSVPMAINFGEQVVPSNAPLAPLAVPVVNPTINGSNLFTTTELNNTVVTLSWSAPSGTAPYGYTVHAFQVTTMPNELVLATAGTYGTQQTSVTLPPLTAGNTYIFLIVTQVDGIASMATAPFRSQFPTAFATVMSSEITISADASTPELRGDPALWDQFLHPKGEIHRLTASKP